MLIAYMPVMGFGILIGPNVPPSAETGFGILIVTAALVATIAGGWLGIKIDNHPEQSKPKCDEPGSVPKVAHQKLPVRVEEIDDQIEDNEAYLFGGDFCHETVDWDDVYKDPRSGECTPLDYY